MQIFSWFYNKGIIQQSIENALKHTAAGRSFDRAAPSGWRLNAWHWVHWSDFFPSFETR